MATRGGNFESRIHLGKDGRFHAWVNLGRRTDGSYDRRQVNEKPRQRAVAKVAEYQRERDRNRGRGVGSRKVKVEDFAGEWLDTVRLERAPATWESYRMVARTYLAGSRLATMPMSAVTVRDIDAWIVQVAAKHGAMAAQKARRTLSAMFGTAVKKQVLPANPVAGSTTPRAKPAELVPLDAGEIARVLEEAVAAPHPARWGLALACGLRQGECLGLRAQDLDVVNGTIRISGKTQALPWLHGCSDDIDQPTCGRVAKSCPRRWGGGVHWQAFGKTDKTLRTVAVPPQVMSQIASELETRAALQKAAGDRWHNPFDLVFTGPFGQPIRPETDNRAWHALLTAAGVRQMRLHGARHSTATALLDLVDPRIVVEVMGWSSGAMLQRYQHPGRSDLRRASDKLAERLWSSAPS